MEQDLNSIYENCKIDIDIPLKFEILGSIDMEIIHDMKMAAIYGISTKIAEPIGILTVPDEEYEDIKKQIEEMGMEIIE